MKALKILFKNIIVIMFLLSIFICESIWAENPEQDDIEYRDYLIAILKTIPERNIGGGEEFPLDDNFQSKRTEEEISQLLYNFLRNKLKQNFETNDETIIGANTVAIKVIKRALTEDFNILPSGMPSQEGYEERAYLNILIALTEKTQEELQKKYHINLGRLDFEQTTRVKENIFTLQSFMRDDEEFYRKPLDSDALINTTRHPFFFYKDEWRRYTDKSFYAENHYNIKTGVFGSEQDKENARSLIEQISDSHKGSEKNMIYTKLQNQMEKFLKLDEHLQKGHRYFQKGKFGLAEYEYVQAVETVSDIGKERVLCDINSQRDIGSSDSSLVNASVYRSTISAASTASSRMSVRYEERNNMRIKTIEDLSRLESLNTVNCYSTLPIDCLPLNDDLLSLVPHVLFFLLPVCFGDLYMEMGEFQKAAYYYSLCLPEKLLRASFEKTSPPVLLHDTYSEPEMGYLPWNWSPDWEKQFNKYISEDKIYNDCEIIPIGYPYLNKDCEVPFMKMRICKLYLNWAEQLYRSNGETEQYRARELYKAVLQEYGVWNRLYTFLSYHEDNNHREEIQQNNILSGKDILLVSNIIDLGIDVYIEKHELPEVNIDPVYERENILQSGETDKSILKFTGPLNPLIRTQINKAYLYFNQINAGLNFFGFSYNEVPSLRFEVLMESAKYYTQLAKQAEDDFIEYKDKEEREEIELMNARHAIDIANILIDIENQRVYRAAQEIKIAEIQVQQVKDVIAAKEEELEEKSSYFGQVKSYFTGMTGFVKSVPNNMLKSVGKDFLSELKGTETAGTGVLGGMAIFGVASAVTINGMVSEADDLQSQIEKLKTQTLPMAEAALQSKKHDLNIAQLQKDIALLEDEFLRELYRFHSLKILNAETWNWMADIVKKSMQRYLDLGTMTGWLAQRALSFEQNRDITIMGLNYYNPENNGLMSSEELRGDLANLEKEYLLGYRNIIPVKWNVSLSRDYPLAFGQLVSTGKCQFKTNSEDLKRAFPGSYLHRIRAVNVSVLSPITEASYMGTIGNSGISYIDDKVLIRSPEALPISEFNLKEDMALYGLPGKALMTFEGSGMDTIWNIQLPPEANPGGLSTIADVIISFDLYTQFSALEEKAFMALIPETKSRLTLFSYKKSKPDDFNSFINSETDTILFSINNDDFSPFEDQKKAINIYITFIGKNIPEIRGRISNEYDTAGIAFTTNEGIVYSSHLSKQSPFMHNDIATAIDWLELGIPQQDWIIIVPGNENSALERMAIEDIIFGIEYEVIPKDK